MSTAPKLYTPEVLGLAVRLAAWPHDPDMPLQGRARSASCGSVLNLSAGFGQNDSIDRLGIAAQACAVGQASAAIFADHALGRSAGEIEAALGSIEAWLKGKAPLPAWPGLATIAAAKDYPARHGAVLLPWKAALDALP